MSSLRLFLLGTPRLERDEEVVEFRYRRNIALLAYLAVTGTDPGRASYTREALITLLWPEAEPSRGRAGLRRNLSALRKTLGEGWLVADRETVCLNPDAEMWVDVNCFQRLLKACQAHPHPEAGVCPECIARLTEAVALYRDDFLAGFTLPESPGFDDWQFFETEGLKDELAGALVRLATCHTSQGDFEAAIAYARRWLALDPLHEPAHRCLMQLYAQAGQRAAALRQYEECVRILDAELGLSPSEGTASLYERIRTGPAGGKWLPASTARPRHNLPPQPTPFIGREVILAGIKGYLEDPACRLLTLVGPGGSGKTRLAVEAAAAQLDNFEQGVFFASLAPVQSVDSIVPAVAQALGFSFYTAEEGGVEVEPQQQLLDYLRQKHVLLILDSFEHLLARPEPSRGDGVSLVVDILKVAPAVQILVTSRARLKLQGEHLFPVAGMEFPNLVPAPPAAREREEMKNATEYSAVKLFLASARRAQPGFDLTAGNMVDVVRICRLVEGMPLGVLLAAAWVGMLTPAEIADQIGRGIDFLETDLRDVPGRQRSMRAAFDHSWNLLAGRQQKILQALSVFRGGFTHQAALEVTSASLAEFKSLVDRSLVNRASTGRFEMHELLRQYAEEKLERNRAADKAVRDLHCAHYVAALHQWALDLKGPRQQTALAEMDVEIENGRAAWDWATEQKQIERLDQAMEGLGIFYRRRGRYREAEDTYRLAAERISVAVHQSPTLAGDELRVLAKILSWQGAFSEDKLDRQLLEQSLALLDRADLAGQDTRSERAFVLGRMSDLLFHHDLEKARRLREQSLALYRALGDRWRTAAMLCDLGIVLVKLCEYGVAKELVEEGLAIQQALGDQLGIAGLLLTFGILALRQAQFEEAEALMRECLAIHQKMGGLGHIANGLLYVGSTICFCGKFVEAHALMEESLAIHSDMGDRWGLTWSHIHLGAVSAHLGYYEQARARGNKGLTLAREHDWIGTDGYSLFVLGMAALGERACAKAHRLLHESVSAYRKSQQLDDLGQALAALGYAARGLGQSLQAQECLSEVLRVVAETGSIMPLMHALPAVALLLADRGEAEQAVEIYAFASRYGFVANSRWFDDVAGKQIAVVAAALPPDVVAAAQERGRARDVDATVAELLEELGG